MGTSLFSVVYVITIPKQKNFFCDIVTLRQERSDFLFRTWQINCVMVPMGQETHQLRGLNKTRVSSPRMVEVSITL